MLVVRLFTRPSMQSVPDPWDTLGALIGEVQQGASNQESKWKGTTSGSISAILQGAR
jgi:hypothetical protein